jgi:hypothetical protein
LVVRKEIRIFLLRRAHKHGLNLSLTFLITIEKNVIDGEASPAQFTTDKQTSVAINRIMLRTHKGNSVLLCPFDDALKTLFKFLSARHLFVIGHTFTVQIVALWSAAKFVTKKSIINLIETQRSSKIVLIKLRLMTRERRASHISDGCDVRRSQEAQKLLVSVARVTDRKYRSHGVIRLIALEQLPQSRLGSTIWEDYARDQLVGVALEGFS